MSYYADSLFPLVPKEDEEQDYLEHYGVLGMKWGVRRNPQKAGRKSLKKLAKLDKKAEKNDRKAVVDAERAASARYKADVRRSTSWTKMGQRKADRLDETARKTEIQARLSRARADRYASDAKRWASSMNKVFKDVKISDVSYEDRQLGKKYMLDILDKEKKTK